MRSFVMIGWEYAYYIKQMRTIASVAGPGRARAGAGGFVIGDACATVDLQRSSLGHLVIIVAGPVALG
jgi:hypothetical protein